MNVLPVLGLLVLTAGLVFNALSARSTRRKLKADYQERFGHLRDNPPTSLCLMRWLREHPEQDHASDLLQQLHWAIRNGAPDHQIVRLRRQLQAELDRLGKDWYFLPKVN